MLGPYFSYKFLIANQILILINPQYYRTFYT